MNSHALSFSLAALALATPPATAAVINVPGDAPTIQIAINIASGGDEIVVAPGTYFEAIDLIGKTLTIRSSGGPGATTIDGFGQFTHVIAIDSGEGPATLIEGFTLQNGEALGASPNDRGGALYFDGTSPTIRDCVITANTAVYGGGIYCNAASPAFENCSFVGNDATNSGGGAYLNASTTSVTDCIFDGNDAQGAVAGGLRVANGSMTITRTAFLGNTSVTEGGAIEVELGAQLTVDDGWFQNNYSGDGGSSGRGGGIHAAGTSNVTVTNSVFYDNGCTRFGAALYAARPILARNCTFYGNLTDSGTEGVVGATVATLYNCMAWGNGNAAINANAIAQYSNIEGGFAGTGNIGGSAGDEPLFIDAAGGDLRLADGSPGIDAGNSSLVPEALDKDLDGLARVVNGLESGATGNMVFGYYVDMGAYEFQPSGGGLDPCPVDTNADAIIDVQDLLSVLAAWGTCP